ncbi:hypothetical protein BSF38_03563 [Paludisphaera borealis]|uniref:Uncharacterized protein n=1 Tax=Paludisphaera borealis TaxID=1387353 RepID=A0A1U7CSX4_9BACT|nr:hypothetical protein BSF38_03563 [Paludisphaera borealis]
MMTLGMAVQVLNQRRHHGHSDWYVSGDGDDDAKALVLGRDRYEFFEPFEALAIAEKYMSSCLMRT